MQSNKEKKTDVGKHRARDSFRPQNLRLLLIATSSLNPERALGLVPQNLSISSPQI